MANSQENLTLTNHLEKNISNNRNGNLYSKENSISNKRRIIMKDVFELLKINKSYDERVKDMKKYMEKAKSYKILNLTVASTSLNYTKSIFSINPYGMIDDNKNITKDGIALFGYEPFNDLEKNIDEENYMEKISIYDFIFPINNENSINLSEFPSFSIYFNTEDENYYIKDFNIGIGALMKIKKYKIENNTLINIGANYLVICIENTDLEIKIFNNNILESNNEEKKKFDTICFKINDNEDKIITIGRNKKCDVSIEDMMMSKIQSCIKYNSEEKAFYLYDGNSKRESMNGTWVYIMNPILITDNFIFKAEHTLFVVNLIDNK